MSYIVSVGKLYQCGEIYPLRSNYFRLLSEKDSGSIRDECWIPGGHLILFYVNTSETGKYLRETRRDGEHRVQGLARRELLSSIRYDTVRTPLVYDKANITFVKCWVHTVLTVCSWWHCPSSFR